MPNPHACKAERMKAAMYMTTHYSGSFNYRRIYSTQFDETPAPWPQVHRKANRPARIRRNFGTTRDVSILVTKSDHRNQQNPTRSTSIQISSENAIEKCPITRLCILHEVSKFIKLENSWTARHLSKEIDEFQTVSSKSSLMKFVNKLQIACTQNSITRVVLNGLDRIVNTAS